MLPFLIVGVPHGVPIPESSWWELLLWRLGRRAQVVMQGASMVPTLLPSTSLLVDKGAYRKWRPQVGDVVLAQHPTQPIRIIKRVTVLSAAGVWLEGDNKAASSDSRQFGAVIFENVLGRVCSRLPADTSP